MSAIDLIDDTFPHGTVAGYRAGCKSSGCPAVLACRAVAIRYAGDYGFSRAIDAGRSVAEIVAEEAAREDERAAAEKAAARAERAAERARSKPARRSGTVRVSPTEVQERRDRVRALHAEGLTDAQIADRMGTAKHRVAHDRRAMGIPPQESPFSVESGARNRARVAELSAEGLDVYTIAERAGISVQAVRSHRSKLGLSRTVPGPVKQDRTQGVWAQVRALFGEGATDEQIAASIGRSVPRVHAIRAELGLRRRRARV